MSLRRLTANILKKQHVSSFIYSPTRCSGNLTNNDPPPSKNLELTLSQKTYAYFEKGRELAWVIRDGIRDVFTDAFKLMKVMRRVQSYNDGFKLTFEELEVLYEFRYEMSRLYPVLCLGILPFGNCLAIPLVIKYPRKFLSHHFWTENQKVEFSKMDHQRRVNMYLPVLSDLDTSDAVQRCPQWRKVLDTVNSGKTPAYDELFKCVSLFEGTVVPFSLDRMQPPLQKKLIEMHCMSHVWSKFSRLFAQGSYILFTDYQIRNTGGSSTLSFWRLKKYCLIRGVNAHEMTEFEMQKWLDEWTGFTKNLAVDNLGLILVAPALVTFNHPSNASLIFNP